jgi:hypothetical protein
VRRRPENVLGPLLLVREEVQTRTLRVLPVVLDVKVDTNRAYMDVAFAGGPVQCDEETCKVMSELIEFRDTMRPDQPLPSTSITYLYCRRVDGDCSTGCFKKGTERPVQCDEETCKVMSELIEFRDTMGLNEAYQVSLSFHATSM